MKLAALSCEAAVEQPKPSAAEPSRPASSIPAQARPATAAAVSADTRFHWNGRRFNAQLPAPLSRENKNKGPRGHCSMLHGRAASAFLFAPLGAGRERVTRLTVHWRRPGRLIEATSTAYSRVTDAFTRHAFLKPNHRPELDLNLSDGRCAPQVLGQWPVSSLVVGPPAPRECSNCFVLPALGLT